MFNAVGQETKNEWTARQREQYAVELIVQGFMFHVVVGCATVHDSCCSAGLRLWGEAVAWNVLHRIGAMRDG